jgi:hypothetical protein
MNYEIINKLTPELMLKWEKYVSDHPHGNIFQTPEMYKVYQNTKNYEPVLLVIEIILVRF